MLDRCLLSCNRFVNGSDRNAFCFGLVPNEGERIRALVLVLSDVGQYLKFVTGWGEISLFSASGKPYLK